MSRSRLPFVLGVGVGAAATLAGWQTALVVWDKYNNHSRQAQVQHMPARIEQRVLHEQRVLQSSMPGRSAMPAGPYAVLAADFAKAWSSGLLAPPEYLGSDKGRFVRNFAVPSD